MSVQQVSQFLLLFKYDCGLLCHFFNGTVHPQQALAPPVWMHLHWECSEAAVMVDHGIDSFCGAFLSMIPIFEEKNSQLAKILT